MRECLTSDCNEIRAVRRGCGTRLCVGGDQVTREPTSRQQTDSRPLDLASSVTFHKTQMPPIKEEEEDELDQSTSEEGDAYIDEEYTLSGTLEPGNPARWACSALLGTIYATHFQSLGPQRWLTLCCSTDDLENGQIDLDAEYQRGPCDLIEGLVMTHWSLRRRLG